MFPNLSACAGTYYNMEVTIATVEYKQAKNVPAVNELTQLRLGQNCAYYYMINVPHFSVLYAVVT